MRVLIISPYFPPSNAPDMQRIRMSLPFFKEFGWEAEVVAVEERFSEMVKDDLLFESVPPDIIIHYVSALSKKWTGKVGLGSLGLRSLPFYAKKVNRILRGKNFDLIYFSTTQFSVTILGAYWKKKFGIPYVIDMQDPWHSDYYLNKPKAERPPKYWFAYHLNKWLEPVAMKNVSGIVSVSKAYIETLENRYSNVKSIPSAVITFGAFKKDFEIADSHPLPINYPKRDGKINIVYVGVVGAIMNKALHLIFQLVSNFKIDNPEVFDMLRFHFIGTSYAPKYLAKESVMPIASQYGLQKVVFEQTDRVGYYQAIKNMLGADALLMPGSDDPNYTASKLYPYILANKPLLAVFHPKSSVRAIIKECRAGTVINIDDEVERANTLFNTFLNKLVNPSDKRNTSWAEFQKYTARIQTKKQCDLFNLVINFTPIFG